VLGELDNSSIVPQPTTTKHVCCFADVADKFRRSPILRASIRVTAGEITATATGSGLRILSSDGPTEYGLRPNGLGLGRIRRMAPPGAMGEVMVGKPESDRPGVGHLVSWLGPQLNRSGDSKDRRPRAGTCLPGANVRQGSVQTRSSSNGGRCPGTSWPDFMRAGGSSRRLYHSSGGRRDFRRALHPTATNDRRQTCDRVGQWPDA
jgi:hypothetical protein